MTYYLIVMVLFLVFLICLVCHIGYKDHLKDKNEKIEIYKLIEAAKKSLEK